MDTTTIRQRIRDELQMCQDKKEQNMSIVDIILERLEAKHEAWLDSGFESEYPHLTQLAYSPKASTDEKRNTIQEIIDVYEEIKANY